ncbi:MAG: hypothetical protein ACOCRL_00705 [Bacillota bacterium]
MSELKKVLVLNNEIEASLMQDILDDEEIPYMITPYRDIAYDGIFQVEGWGHIAAEMKYHQEILNIYAELLETLENDNDEDSDDNDSIDNA